MVILNAVAAVSNIAFMLLNLRINKDQTVGNIMKTMTPLMQRYAGSITTLGCFQSAIEKNR